MDYQLQKEIIASRGYQIFMRLKSLNDGRYILDQNYLALIKLFDYFNKEEDIWYMQNREKLDTFQLEYARHLHNYVASVKSLVDHTRRLVKWVNDENFTRDYENKRKEVLENICVKLVQQLREYAQHYSVPPVGVSVQILNVNKPDMKEIRRLTLGTNSLLEYKEWKSDVKNYLKSTKELDVIALTTDYQKLIQIFYNWFYKRFNTQYKGDLDKFYKKAKEHDD